MTLTRSRLDPACPPQRGAARKGQKMPAVSRGATPNGRRRETNWNSKKVGRETFSTDLGGFSGRKVRARKTVLASYIEVTKKERRHVNIFTVTMPCVGGGILSIRIRMDNCAHFDFAATSFRRSCNLDVTSTPQRLGLQKRKRLVPAYSEIGRT